MNEAQERHELTVPALKSAVWESLPAKVAVADAKASDKNTARAAGFTEP